MTSGAQALDALAFLERADDHGRDTTDVLRVGDEGRHGELGGFSVVAVQRDAERVVLAILLKGAVAPPVGARYPADRFTLHTSTLPRRSSLQRRDHWTRRFDPRVGLSEPIRPRGLSAILCSWK